MAKRKGADMARQLLGPQQATKENDAHEGAGGGGAPAAAAAAKAPDGPKKLATTGGGEAEAQEDANAYAATLQQGGGAGAGDLPPPNPHNASLLLPASTTRLSLAQATVLETFCEYQVDKGLVFADKAAMDDLRARLPGVKDLSTKVGAILRNAWMKKIRAMVARTGRSSPSQTAVMNALDGLFEGAGADTPTKRVAAFIDNIFTCGRMDNNELQDEEAAAAALVPAGVDDDMRRLVFDVVRRCDSRDWEVCKDAQIVRGAYGIAFFVHALAAPGHGIVFGAGAGGAAAAAAAAAPAEFAIIETPPSLTAVVHPGIANGFAAWRDDPAAPLTYWELIRLLTTHLCKNKLAFPTHGDIPHGGGGGGGAGADGATPYVLGPVKTPHGYTRGAAATPAAGNTVALAKLTMLRELFEKGTLPLDVFMAEMAKLQ